MHSVLLTYKLHDLLQTAILFTLNNKFNFRMKISQEDAMLIKNQYPLKGYDA